MHPPRTRETTLTGRAETGHGVRSVLPLTNSSATPFAAYNDATPLKFNDADH
jgi:hypothetical protein